MKMTAMITIVTIIMPMTVMIVAIVVLVFLIVTLMMKTLVLFVSFGSVGFSKVRGLGMLSCSVHGCVHPCARVRLLLAMSLTISQYQYVDGSPRVPSIALDRTIL